MPSVLEEVGLAASKKPTLTSGPSSVERIDSMIAKYDPKKGDVGGKARLEAARAKAKAPAPAKAPAARIAEEEDDGAGISPTPLPSFGVKTGQSFKALTPALLE